MGQAKDFDTNTHNCDRSYWEDPDGNEARDAYNANGDGVSH